MLSLMNAAVPIEGDGPENRLGDQSKAALRVLEGACLIGYISRRLQMVHEGKKQFECKVCNRWLKCQKKRSLRKRRWTWLRDIVQVCKRLFCGKTFQEKTHHQAKPR